MDNVRHSVLSRPKSWFGSLALVLFMIVVTGCSGFLGGGSPGNDGLISVSGFVYEESEGGGPVAGARLQLGDHETTSDADGAYSFINISAPGSSVTIRVTAKGYEARSVPIPLQGDTAQFLDISLRPAEPQPGDGSGDGDTGTGPDDGSADGDAGKDPGVEPPPTEPEYEGNVEVSVQFINAGVSVTAAETPERPAFSESVRPVSALRRTSFDDHVPGEWIVELDRTTGVHPIRLGWNEAGLRIERQLSDNFYLVTADESDAARVEARLADMPDVVSFGRNRVVSPIAVHPVMPNDEYFFRQWSLPLISAPYAWALTTGNDNVVVAVLDTGLVSHDDIRQSKLVKGRNFVGDQSATNYRDNTNNFSHGTMVTGIIGADSNNRTGVTGLAWDVTLMPLRVIGSNGNGNIAGVGDGIKYAVDNGAHIINMSLAWDSNPNDAGERYVRQQIERAADRGVVMIAGAGNDDGRVTMPAAHPDVIAVGAVDKHKRRTWYSNYGNGLDIVAPGGDQPTDALYRDGVLSTDIANGRPYYTYEIGTSFASPHVTGVVALMYSRGITDPYEIREILFDTAEDLGTPGYDVYYGHGLINAYAAVAGVRRTDALVGVAAEDGTVFGPVAPEPYGETASALVEGAPPGQQTVFAWIDVNGDGVLDSGDFAAVDTARVPANGTIQTDLKLQIVDTMSNEDKQRLQAIINR